MPSQTLNDSEIQRLCIQKFLSLFKILLDSPIDLEVSAHKTSGFVAYVYPTLDGPTPRQLKINIPIHGRYSEPSFDGKTFTSVNIEPPELLLSTEKCKLFFL